MTAGGGRPAEAVQRLLLETDKSFVKLPNLPFDRRVAGTVELWMEDMKALGEVDAVPILLGGEKARAYLQIGSGRIQWVVVPEAAGLEKDVPCHLVILHEIPPLPYHVAASWAPDALPRLFVNGKEVNKRTDYQVRVPDNAPTTIGDDPKNVQAAAGASCSFSVRDVRISRGVRFKTDFTPARVLTADMDTAALYPCDDGQGDVLRDASGNKHHGKIVGAKWVKGAGPKTPAGPPDFALSYAGNEAGVWDGASVPNGGPWTVEGRITPRMSEKAGQGRYEIFSGPLAVAVVRDAANQKLYWAGWNTDENGVNELRSTQPVGLNQTAHVAVVYDTETLRLFVDGVPQGERPLKFKGTPIKVFMFAGPSGGAITGGNGFVGLIDEVRFSSVARYKAAFTPQKRLEPDADTIALYHFDEGTGEAYNDSSANKHHGKATGAKWVQVEGAADVGAAIPAGEFQPLFNGKDLTGWQVKGEKSEWAIDPATGVLTAAGKAPGYLFTEKEYGDFTLKLEFQLDAKANSGVVLRADPAEASHVEVQLADVEQFPTGMLFVTENSDQGGYLATDGKVSLKKEWNEMEVERRGSNLRVTVNGAVVQIQDLSRFAGKPGVLPGVTRKAGRIGLQSQTGQAKFRNIRIETGPAADAGWKPLFNGKDLTGWKSHPEQPGNWKVENGVLVGSKAKGHLFTDLGDFDNFHARLKVKLNKPGNSGLYFRAPFALTGGEYPSGGYEAQMEYTGLEQFKTGSVFGFEHAGKNFQVPPDAWFTLEVIADGNHIVTKINGETYTDFTEKDPTYQKGHFAIQCMTVGTVVQVESFEVKRLNGVDPDRTAAERALSIGSIVFVEAVEKVHDVRAVKDLPPGKFSVTHIDFSTKATNDDLEILKPLTAVIRLGLNCPKISGAGLEHLQTLTKLEYLDLNSSAVSGDDLARLKALPKLHTLLLQGTRVGDDGMANLKSIASLRLLDVGYTNVGDAELAQLKARTDLERLSLDGTTVSDGGLAHLTDLKGLRKLHLKSTKVTAAGVKKLAAALPECRIESDHGVIEPKK